MDIFSSHADTPPIYLDFLIIANGLYEHEVILSLIEKKKIIALDGAANNLKDIIPDYILGDFDSIEPKIEEKYRLLNVPFIETDDQDFTDLEKAITFAKNCGAKSISICCALGGERTDHTLGNLSVLKKMYEKSCRMTLHTPKENICFLKDEKFSFKGTTGASCGFFGWPNATVTTSGLVWDVKNWNTQIGNRISSCNKLKEHHIEIEVKGDVLLIYPNY